MKTSMAEIIQLAADCLYGTEPEPMTIEEAAYNIRQWTLEGNGDEIPEGLTPEVYATTWNRMIEGSK